MNLGDEGAFPLNRESGVEGENKGWQEANHVHVYIWVVVAAVMTWLN